MKRLMVLVAMMALMLAAAAPAAFANHTTIDLSEQGDNVEFNGVCQNIIGSVNTGDNTATANATANSFAGAEGGDDAVAVADGDATARISQNSGATVGQANVCFNSFFFGGFLF